MTVIDLGDPMPWADSALCAQTDPDMWFSEKGDPGRKTRNARKICSACPVRVECLDWALRNDERHGVWGGTNEMERRELKRKAAA